jgi:hypothetical protein
MRKTTGREGKRDWTQYGFRLNGKNHKIVIQRTWNDNFTNPFWYTFHLEGSGQNDPIYTIKEAPLSRQLAESFAKQYIREYIEQGHPISIQYDITHKKKIRVLQVTNRREN